MAISVALDTNNTPAQNKAELVNALASYQTRGGEIRLPRSEAPFPMSPGIVWPGQRNLCLLGEGKANAYEDGWGGTQIKFTSGGVGIDCSQIDVNSPAAPYAFIGGVSFHGDSVCSQGLRLGGIMHVEHVEAKCFTQANIRATKLVNSMVLDHVSVLAGGIGLAIGGDDLNGGENPNNTRIIVNELVSRANQVGVRIEQAQGVRFNGGVIEANYNEGLVIYRNSGRVLEDIILRDMWFEGNWRGALGYAVSIGGNGVLPSNVRLMDSHISVGGLSKAILISRLDGGLVSHLAGSGDVDLEGNCHNVGLLDVPSSFTVSDAGTGNWQRSRSQIGSGGGVVGGGSGTWPLTTEHTLPDQNQPLLAVQVVQGLCEIFPTGMRTLPMPSATDIIAEMGGYEAGATTEFVLLNRSPVSAPVVFLNGVGTTVKGNNQIGLGSGTFAVRIDSPTHVSIINKSRN